MRRTGIVLLLTSIFVSLANAETRRPNIIIIFTDDHGFSDLRSQGVFKDLKTPHLDALVAGGVLMKSGYASAPQCVPSRAGLMVGKYQNRFGVESNRHSLEGFNDERTVAEKISALGYATGMTGKWHLGPTNQITDHGFQDVYAKNSARPGWSNFGLDGSDKPPGPESTKLYHIDANSAATCAFIKRHRSEPLFFYCAYRAPHVPLDAPKKYLSRFPGEMPERRRQALAMLSAIDDGVGQIISTLRECEIEENTLLFFIGDNGAPLKIHKLDAPGGGPGWDGSLNDPLNGEKGMLSEGGIRVPFIASWKGKIPGGQVYTHPVISLDATATALALAQSSAPDSDSGQAGQALDGVNLVPYLTGENKNAPHERLYWRWIAQSAVREGNWKYLRGGEREYLFDLEKDIEEKQNILDEHPEIAKRLRSKLEAWASKLSPAGLATNPMSQTWEDYFDFYLDGKPAPPLPKVKAANLSTTNDDKIGGWVVRGGHLEQTKRGLAVRPQESNKKRAATFIAANGLKLPNQCRVTVKLAVDDARKVRLTWRIGDSKEFVPAKLESSTHSDNITTLNYSIDSPKPVVHFRLRTENQPTVVNLIEVTDIDDKPVKRWSFLK